MRTFTPMQAATALGWSLARVYRGVNTGHLRTVGGQPYVAIDPEHVAERLASRAEAERHSMDVSTAAERLGLSRQAVYRLVYGGQLERWPAGRREMRISNASVRRLAAAWKRQQAA